MHCEVSLSSKGRSLTFVHGDIHKASLSEFHGTVRSTLLAVLSCCACRRDECERVKKCGARVLTLDQLEGSKVSQDVNEVIHLRSCQLMWMGRYERGLCVCMGVWVRARISVFAQPFLISCNAISCW